MRETVCSVHQIRGRARAESFTKSLGLPESDLGGGHGFNGCVIPARDASWVEIWQKGEDMPVGLMLQLIVDDAKAVAA